jgi:hypothetical protein
VGILFVFIFFVGNTEYRLLVRREQEAAYWAEVARRVSALDAQPEPPLLQSGPN